MEVNELHWDHWVRDTRMDLPEKQPLSQLRRERRASLPLEEGRDSEEGKELMEKRLDNLPSEDNETSRSENGLYPRIVPTLKLGNSLCVGLFTWPPFPSGRIFGDLRRFELATRTREAAEKHPDGIHKAGKRRQPPDQSFQGKGAGIFRRPLGQFRQPRSLGRPRKQDLSRVWAPGGPQPCQDKNSSLYLANSPKNNTDTIGWNPGLPPFTQTWSSKRPQFPPKWNPLSDRIVHKIAFHWLHFSLISWQEMKSALLSFTLPQGREFT